MLIVAASNENTVKNFHIPNKSILSKGGKINENGEPVKVIKLDNLKIDKTNFNEEGKQKTSLTSLMLKT